MVEERDMSLVGRDLRSVYGPGGRVRGRFTERRRPGGMMWGMSMERR